MQLQQQETQEPETSEVIRLAQQMYERDRAEQERQSSLAAAAEEVGIPPEYLTKATAQLKARRMVAPQQIQSRRSPVAALIAGAIAAFIAIMLGYFLTATRVAPPPMVPATIEAPPPPIPAPVATQPGPVTQPPDPYPAQPSTR